LLLDVKGRAFVLKRVPWRFVAWYSFAGSFIHPKEFFNMSKIFSVVFGSLFVAGLMFSQVASAASDCEAKALSKDGKPLAGAAKASSIKKCEAAAPKADSGCADKAKDKNGKALAGAAKNSFMKKCEAEAK
jgi:hypothetical protein